MQRISGQRTCKIMTREQLYKKHLRKCQLLFPRFKAQGEPEKARKVYLIMKRLIERRKNYV